MSLCQYRDSLGKPGQGFHAARLGGFAAWDVLGTVGLGFGAAWLLGYGRSPTAVLLAVLLAFIVGIILHWAFCVDTTLNVLLLGPAGAAGAAGRSTPPRDL